MWFSAFKRCAHDLILPRGYQQSVHVPGSRKQDFLPFCKVSKAEEEAAHPVMWSSWHPVHLSNSRKKTSREAAESNMQTQDAEQNRFGRVQTSVIDPDNTEWKDEENVQHSVRVIQHRSAPI